MAKSAFTENKRYPRMLRALWSNQVPKWDLRPGVGLCGKCKCAKLVFTRWPDKEEPARARRAGKKKEIGSATCARGVNSEAS